MRKRMKGRPPHISGSQIIEAEKGEEKGERKRKKVGKGVKGKARKYIYSRKEEEKKKGKDNKEGENE